MHQNTLTPRLIGFLASLILTLLAFLLALQPKWLHISMQVSIFLIFTFAFLQFIVQSIFFLNVLNEKGTRWNLIVFISTLSIMFIVIVGSIWIMNHLNDNMMIH